jgi:hypothetical protein
MGRLVRVPREVSPDYAGADGVYHIAGGGHGSFVQADTYLERIAKYVPAEALAFSVFINAMLNQALKTTGPTAMMAGMPVSTIATAVLIAGTVLTPFFMWYMRRPGDAWGLNAFVSTLLYPFWAYALGSPAFAGYWDGNLAAILLASVTVVSGLFSPRLPSPKRRARERDLEEERLRAMARPHLAPAPIGKPEPVPAAAKK